METPEKHIEWAALPSENNFANDMKEIIKQLKHISQELNTLNRTLKQRR